MVQKKKTTAVTTRQELQLERRVEELLAKLEQMNRSNGMGGEAMLKLVNLTFDTPARLLPELTFIPKASVLTLSIMMMREVAIDRPIDPDTGKPMRLSKCWRIFWMQLNRSIGRHHVEDAVKLAETQQMKEEEQPEEPKEW